MKWLTKDIATAPFNEIDQSVLSASTVIIDVRDLVDKSGNDLKYISSKIQESVDQLKSGNKIIVCCDYGLSRSNSMAIGVMVKWLNITFTEAVGIAKKVVDESGIKIEMLNTVYSALYSISNEKQKNSPEIKNIYITGASGFLGRSLINKIGKKYKLYCPSSKDVNLIENVVELDLLIKLNKIDCIVHLANPKVFTNSKAIGETLVMLKNVLDVCRTNNVKIIYLSGWEIYSGYRSEKLLANELLNANPKGTYGETKWLSELLIKQYSNNYNLDYQIIRSGPVYGMNGEKPKFIYNFIDKAIKGDKISTHQYLNGDPSLDLLYIDDLIKLLEKAISSNFTGEINVGSGEITSTFDTAVFICELIGSSSKLERVKINEYAANILMDNTRANILFAWKPEINLKHGLKKVIETYKK